MNCSAVARVSGSVAVWDVVKTGGGFGTISQVNLKTLSSYGPHTLAIGWTHILDTPSGVLFYNAATGEQAVADIGGDGSVNMRQNSGLILRTGWTNIISANNDILFYDAATGDVSFGIIFKVPFIQGMFIGTLNIRKEYQQYFAQGWTHIVTTVDPTVVK